MKTEASQVKEVPLSPNSALVDVDATGSTFAKFQAPHSLFTSSTVFNSCVHGSNLEGCTFETCELDGSVFRGCSFKGVELQDCDIEGLIVNGIRVGALLKLLVAEEDDDAR